MLEQRHGTNDDWKQWQAALTPAPRELWTRAEILEAAERLGVRRPDGQPVDDRTLRFWEENGIIPRGIEGKIAGRNYTYRLYPWWVVDLLHQVCRYQQAQIRLEDLPQRMRIEALYLSLNFLWERPKDAQAYADTRQLSSYIHRALREPTLPPFVRRLGGGDEVERQAADFLKTLALSLSWAGFPRAERGRVQFFDSEGKETVSYETDLRAYQFSSEQQESLDRLKAETASWAASFSDSGTSKE